MDDNNLKLFEFIKLKQFSELFEFIKNNNTDLNIKDKQSNYIINYLILYEQLDIIKYILENNDINIDILDTDNRTILYNPIKYNSIEILQQLINYNYNNIGLDIINIKDNSGYTSLHYSCIFNNFEAFQILYNINKDISITDNDDNNIIQIGLIYKRTKIILFLIKNEIDNLDNFIGGNNESILQTAINYENDIVINKVLNEEKLLNYIINNQESEYGLTALHQCVVLSKNNIAFELLKNNANYNISDFLGNTPQHYALIEDNFEYFTYILNKYELNYNDTSLSGDTLLHLYLTNNKINYNTVLDSHLNDIIKLIKLTNLNIQNNTGNTCLHYIVELNIWKIPEIKTVLEEKKLNIYIQNANEEYILDKLIDNNDKQELINIVVNSYYYQLNKNKDKLNDDWEIYCSTKDLDKLLKILNKRKSDKDIEYYCKDKIRDIIDKKERSIPNVTDIILNIDTIPFKNGCFYTGAKIDVLFGLVYIVLNFKNTSTLLQHPLTENDKLIEYYQKIGKNYDYKIDFSNIEIVWSFQKMILSQNFESILSFKLSNDSRFIIIPLGIEIESMSHANMIIIDKEKKIIERFEPNGQNYPRNLNYNPELLDSILKNIFSQILVDYKYNNPKQYLPTVGFQMLETLDDNKCAKIGDPNGFCAIWCVWWTEQKISNPDIESSELAYKLINQIKISNKSFKNLIRNYSQKVINIRDDILKKYSLSIDDWMISNYNDNDIENISNDVLELIQ